MSCSQLSRFIHTQKLLLGFVFLTSSKTCQKCGSQLKCRGKSESDNSSENEKEIKKGGGNNGKLRSWIVVFLLKVVRGILKSHFCNPSGLVHPFCYICNACMRAYGQIFFGLYHSVSPSVSPRLKSSQYQNQHFNNRQSLSLFGLKMLFTPHLVCMCIPAAAYTTIHLIVASWQLHILISLLHSWMQFFIPVFVLLLLYDNRTCLCVRWWVRVRLLLFSPCIFVYPQRELQWQCKMSVYGSFICNTRIISFVLGSSVIFSLFLAVYFCLCLQ